jgi:hypothetical protein
MYLYYHFTEFASEFADGFTWPLTSEISERRDIYNYITDPYHLYTKGQGKELAINRLAYRRLVESGSLDSSKGDYVRIEHGKLMSYEREISIEECKDLTEKNPGLLYAHIKQQSVVIRFISIANVQLKEWQVSVVFYVNKYWTLLGTFSATISGIYMIKKKKRSQRRRNNE